MSDQPTQPELESVAPQLCMLVLAPRVVDSALFPLAIEMSQAEDPNLVATSDADELSYDLQSILARLRFHLDRLMAENESQPDLPRFHSATWVSKKTPEPGLAALATVVRAHFAAVAARRSEEGERGSLGQQSK